MVFTARIERKAVPGRRPDAAAGLTLSSPPPFYLTNLEYYPFLNYAPAAHLTGSL